MTRKRCPKCGSVNTKKMVSVSTDNVINAKTAT